jgi:hypothetical protein
MSGQGPILVPLPQDAHRRRYAGGVVSEKPAARTALAQRMPAAPGSGLRKADPRVTSWSREIPE